MRHHVLVLLRLQDRESHVAHRTVDPSEVGQEIQVDRTRFVGRQFPGVQAREVAVTNGCDFARSISVMRSPSAGIRAEPSLMVLIPRNTSPRASSDQRDAAGDGDEHSDSNRIRHDLN